MSGKLSADEKKWRAESDLRTLTEAKAIQSDKSRLKAVQTTANKQMASLKSVAGSTKKTSAPSKRK